MTTTAPLFQAPTPTPAPERHSPQQARKKTQRGYRDAMARLEINDPVAFDAIGDYVAALCLESAHHRASGRDAKAELAALVGA